MLVGLIGFMSSGKGRASLPLIEAGFVTESFAAPLKDAVASAFGWPRALLEGDTPESREFRETIDEFWTARLGRYRFTPRKALQEWGVMARKEFSSDIWLASLEKRLLQETHAGRNVVVTDCRFPNEGDKILALGGVLVRIKRGPDPYWLHVAAGIDLDNDDEVANFQKCCGLHVSEWAWTQINQDAVIVVENDGTPEQLEEKIRQLLLSSPPQTHSCDAGNGNERNPDEDKEPNGGGGGGGGGAGAGAEAYERGRKESAEESGAKT